MKNILTLLFVLFGGYSLHAQDTCYGPKFVSKRLYQKYCIEYQNVNSIFSYTLSLCRFENQTIRIRPRLYMAYPADFCY